MVGILITTIIGLVIIAVTIVAVALIMSDCHIKINDKCNDTDEKELSMRNEHEMVMAKLNNVLELKKQQQVQENTKKLQEANKAEQAEFYKILANPDKLLDEEE